MESSNFSKKLNGLLERNGLKQIDLIRIADERGFKLGKSQLSQYLSGKTVPRRDTLEFLASVFGTDADCFLSTEDAEGDIADLGLPQLSCLPIQLSRGGG